MSTPIDPVDQREPAHRVDVYDKKPPAATGGSIIALIVLLAAIAAIVYFLWMR